MSPCQNPSSPARSRRCAVLRIQAYTALPRILSQPVCGLASGYHGLAALPKRETNRPKRILVMTETRLRDEICRLGRSLFERGLTPGSSGNISMKLDDGSYMVTPTNASLGFLDPARLSLIGPDG